MHAEIAGTAAQSVRVRYGRIAAVGPDLTPEAGEEVLDAGGGAVIPGLHDHHVHLHSAAAAASSVALDPRSLPAHGDAVQALQAASRQLAAGAWLRGVGISGSWADTLDRRGVDAVVADRPVRLQHRTGELWILNSAAVTELGVDGWSDGGVERTADGTPTGRLWRLDGRLRAALAGAVDHAVDHAAALHRLSSEALRAGITGVTDATPGLTHADLEAFDALVAQGVIEQRVTVMGGPDLHRRPAPRHVRLGPVKILLDDPTLPTEDELAAVITDAHDRAVPVAIHCVTAPQLVVATAALRLAGSVPGDRIEHAGVVPPGYAAVLADLGVTVVTQPGFVAARGDDYLRDVAEGERAWLYPCASLQAAGVPVAAGSDLPFGPADPWVAMRAAVTRRTGSGAVLGRDERVDAASALRLYLGRADAPGRVRRVAPGGPADLCVLRSPLRSVLVDLGAHQVAAIVVAGAVHAWDR